VFRLAIYFLQRHEKALLKDDFPGMVMRLKEVHKEELLPPHIDDIFTEALKVPYHITTPHSIIAYHKLWTVCGSYTVVWME
jgi:hypothetical protein